MQDQIGLNCAALMCRPASGHDEFHREGAKRPWSWDAGLPLWPTDVSRRHPFGSSEILKGPSTLKRDMKTREGCMKPDSPEANGRLPVANVLTGDGESKGTNRLGSIKTGRRVGHGHPRKDFTPHKLCQEAGVCLRAGTNASILLPVSLSEKGGKRLCANIRGCGELDECGGDFTALHKQASTDQKVAPKRQAFSEQLFRARVRSTSLHSSSSAEEILQGKSGMEGKEQRIKAANCKDLAALDLLRLEQRMQHVISTDSCSQVPKALHLSVTMPSVLLLGDDEVHYSDGAHRFHPAST
jgi:hypothetical protein